MKPLGYILPPIAIVDFAPVYYGTEEEPSCAQTNGHRITGFYKIDPETPRKPIDPDYPAREIGDQSIYCYLGKGGDVYFGEFNEIASKLYPMLFSENLTFFQKLSLAYFFQLKGYQKILIAGINQTYQLQSPGFILLEVAMPVNDIGENDGTAIDTIRNLVNHIQTAMAIYNKKLTWQHILYVDKEGVWFAGYRLSVLLFTKLVPSGKKILLQYLVFLPLRKRYDLFTDNRQIYQLFMDVHIPDPISPADEAEMLEELSVPGEADHQVFQGTERYSVPVFGQDQKRPVDLSFSSGGAGELKKWKESFRRKEKAY